MRHTIVKNGIQERINYLVGTNDTDSDPNPDNSTGVNFWSIQASMITNMQRIIKAINGDIAYGRVMKGLYITQATPGGSVINISPGIGFTVAGNVIITESGIYGVDLGSPVIGDEYNIYLKHIQASDQPNPYAYHMSNIQGATTSPINIIGDDSISNSGDGTFTASFVKIVRPAGSLAPDDGVYLGRVSIIASPTTPPPSSPYLMQIDRTPYVGFSG